MPPLRKSSRLEAKRKTLPSPPPATKKRKEPPSSTPVAEKPSKRSKPSLSPAQPLRRSPRLIEQALRKTPQGQPHAPPSPPRPTQVPSPAPSPSPALPTSVQAPSPVPSPIPSPAPQPNGGHARFHGNPEPSPGSASFPNPADRPWRPVAPCRPQHNPSPVPRLQPVVDLTDDSVAVAVASEVATVAASEVVASEVATEALKPKYPRNEPFDFQSEEQQPCYAMHYHFKHCGHSATVRFCSRLNPFATPAPSYEDYFTSRVPPSPRAKDDTAIAFDSAGIGHEIPAPPKPARKPCQRIWHDVEIKATVCPWCNDIMGEGMPLPCPWLPRDKEDLSFGGPGGGGIIIPLAERRRRRRVARLDVAQVQRDAHWAEVRKLFKYRIWMLSVGEARVRRNPNREIETRECVIADPDAGAPTVRGTGVRQVGDYLIPLHEKEIERLPRGKEKEKTTGEGEEAEADEKANEEVGLGCSICRDAWPSATTLPLPSGAQTIVRLSCAPDVLSLEEVAALPPGATIQDNHVYHRGCIYEWLFLRSPQCPLCRARFDRIKRFKLVHPIEETDLPELLYFVGNGGWFDFQANDLRARRDAGGFEQVRMEIYEEYNDAPGLSRYDKDLITDQHEIITFVATVEERVLNDPNLDSDARVAKLLELLIEEWEDRRAGPWQVWSADVEVWMGAVRASAHEAGLVRGNEELWDEAGEELVEHGEFSEEDYDEGLDEDVEMEDYIW